MIAKARKCNFKEFVNRFSLEDASYAVEYLEAGPELGKEIANEVLQRHRDKVEGYENQRTDEYRSRRLDGGLMNEVLIHAVRIQAQSVLKVLAEVGGYVWGREPYTFMRPFAHLIHFHPKVKDRLESILTTSPPGDEETQQLQCYVSFVEEHLLPLMHQFDDAEDPKARRVRHEDLWYLFKPGELVYVPSNTLQKAWGDDTGSLGYRNRACQSIWRIELLQPHAGDFNNFIYGSAEVGTDAMAYLHFVDFDGTAYRPVLLNVGIPGYNGSKDIRKLELYPLRFAQESEALLAEHRAMGLRFTECIEKRRVTYKAWTLLTDPTGRYWVNSAGQTMRSPEFIEGDVIIDFQEAFKTCPHWKLFYGPDTAGWESRIETNGDEFPIFLWSDTTRTKLLFSWPHVVVSSDDIGFLEAAQFRQKHTYGVSGLEKPVDEDLAILPRRLFGYALRERRFVFLDVKEVKVGYQPLDMDPFQFLQIDPDNKRTIKCLVSDHFRTKKARKAGEIASQDPIPGKGRNLVFLLHGPPRVGKTATVEAVAQAYRKPLFSITSGSLGATPASVEVSLAQIFHLANVWDCILLLDEADVFLEEREKKDLSRNAVVSVFLRVMEYYGGILFLTTNRPGQLDEAVKSRVHSTLLYKALDFQQTREIFRLNIERLELIERQLQANPEPPQVRLHSDKSGILAFAEKHWHKHDNDELGQWNGRQIRNGFILAAALARSDGDYDGYDGVDDNGHGPLTAVVTERHFEFVARNVTNFDVYMAKARRGLDSERAHSRMDRPDHFIMNEERSARHQRRTAAATSNTQLSSSYYPSASQSAPAMPSPAPQPQVMNTGYAYSQMGYNPGPSIMSWPVHPGVQTSMMPIAPSAMPAPPPPSLHGMGGPPPPQQATGGASTIEGTNGLESRQG
ncbi:hypothetical protein QBC34DRAFT_331121 [Podospora aff. communis PSN243]|uniref:AAA+ ATPase domain-containing protein n=1 Tax=Podospora aff. communis PSN243 TaxID=3040156 RepID=A0AAV9GE22_9PEZI|nr:hypothetical protein QBC34DRAFT_331121 [Podospora aff. communis PSN243]